MKKRRKPYCYRYYRVRDFECQQCTFKVKCTEASKKLDATMKRIARETTPR